MCATNVPGTDLSRMYTAAIVEGVKVAARTSYHCAKRRIDRAYGPVQFSWCRVTLRRKRTATWYLQGSAKRWALGCVNSASWLPLAAGWGEFTQPRAHLLADPCPFVKENTCDCDFHVA